MRKRSGHLRLARVIVGTMLVGPLGVSLAHADPISAPAEHVGPAPTSSGTTADSLGTAAPTGVPIPSRTSAVDAGAAAHPTTTVDIPTSLPSDSAALPSKPLAPQAAREGKGVDPEPDVAIRPPVIPSSDPLDHRAASPVVPVQSAEEPLPPLNAAIKNALDKRDAAEMHGANAAERRKEREAITFFYIAHNFAPVWSADGVVAPAVDPVLARLAHAGDDALTLTGVPAVLKTSGTPEEIADSELVLSDAVVAYARQASGSRVDPRSVGPLIGLKPALADATEALETVAAAGTDAGDRLRSYNPAEPRYVALRDKLMELRSARTPATASATSPAANLKIGMRDPRAPLVRPQSGLDGTPDRAPQTLRYDAEVATAGGASPTVPTAGILTKRTIAALSGGRPSRLEGQLIANMEMWRWMPHDLGTDHIEVNVPDFAVTVYRNGAPVSRNRVVVGKKDTPTPLFSNAMKVVIVNPVWNVPESIIKKEMLPKLAQDPDYLARLGYTVVERHGRLTVQQPSGERNALGRVKFIFPNDYAVYLHDTPSKALFASQHRAFSHGCVRVDQPFRFAQSVLDESKWSEKRLLGLLGPKERYVDLPKPMPIHIEYFTASVDQTGRLALGEDVYDYIHRIASTLGHDS